MKQLRNAFLLILLLLLIPNLATAATPRAPKLAAKAYILMDHHSGRIIAEHKSGKRVEPASLTKMMSTYVIEHELKLGNITMEDMVKVSQKAWKMPGSRMFIEVGKRVSVENLIKGIIIQSGNDATVAMAEHIAGSEEAFVSLMNEYAKELGMSGTNYMNATGLPHRKHYTTVTDLATLANAMIREFPTHYKWYSEKEFTFNKIKQSNRNRLLWQDKYVDGIKTGHTESAGFCLTASAVKGNMRLVSVVVGTRSEQARATESQKLLTYGFRFFETHKLYEKNQALTNAKVWKGATDAIPLGLAEDLYITIPRGKYDSLKAKMSIDTQIIAPAETGNVYGKVNINLSREPFLSRDLIALGDVQEGGFFGNLLDDVLLVFE